jgi:hypothetical protein
MRSLNYPEINHIFHIVVKTDGRAACAVCDVSYPSQSGLSAALSLLNGDASTKNLAAELKRLQNPVEADKFFYSFLLF